MSRCPRPGCEGEVAARGVFCADCHCALPHRLRGLIYRTKFAAERADDDDIRKHLREQTAAYVSAAIGTMGWDEGHGAQKQS